MLFCVQFVSILLYFIDVSVIQNFVPFRFSLFSAFLSFFFLTGDDNSAFCQESKSPYFPKILKLMWNSSIIVAWEYVFPIWSRLQISWHRLVTEYTGVICDRTTCRAKIQERGVLRNTWIKGKKATFLDHGQICLAVINYTKVIYHQTLGRPIQVNGAFYSIKKGRVIKYK